MRRAHVKPPRSSSKHAQAGLPSVLLCLVMQNSQLGVAQVCGQGLAAPD